MHSLALGGGSLASLRVVCPERLQRQGTKRRFRDGNHQGSNLAAEHFHQPDPFGGTYLNVGLKTPGFSINPFSLEPTHENLNFLYLFLQVLIESGGRYELTTADEKTLYAALERVYKLPREIRTLTNFASILGPLGERLHRWTRAGQFGYLFDNVEDTLTFSRFQTFNFSGWDKYPDVLEPMLFYVLQRASSEIEKPENVGIFKLFVIDEGWIFFKKRIIRDWITRAEKTWRKLNGVHDPRHAIDDGTQRLWIAGACKRVLSHPDLSR
jgi:type IV secretory pathway VirB4 component